MPNEQNLKTLSPSEAREYGRRGGKASGEARRRRADFRRTLNALLTAQIDNPEWTPILEAMGLDSTLEAAINAAMIREALAGNVKAYIAIRDTLGQTTKSEEDLEEQKVRVAAARARTGQDDGEEQEDDGFVEALAGMAAEDWAEEGRGIADEEEKTDL